MLTIFYSLDPNNRCRRTRSTCSCSNDWCIRFQLERCWPPYLRSCDLSCVLSRLRMGRYSSFLPDCFGNACSRTLYPITVALSVHRWRYIRCHWCRSVLLLRKLRIISSSWIGWSSPQESLLRACTSRVVCQHSSIRTCESRRAGVCLPMLTIHRLQRSTSSFERCVDRTI